MFWVGAVGRVVCGSGVGLIFFEPLNVWGWGVEECEKQFRGSVNRAVAFGSEVGLIFFSSLNVWGWRRRKMKKIKEQKT
jgi:hypothetical protein